MKLSLGRATVGDWRVDDLELTELTEGMTEGMTEEATERTRERRGATMLQRMERSAVVGMKELERHRRD